MQSTAELFLAHMQFATAETRSSTPPSCATTAFSQYHRGAGRPDDRETFACLPSSLWGHSGQMTTEAFGRLASWSSFNIVVGRHDEFAHSRVAIPQKRGTTAKSIVLHFPHPTHSNWKPRKDAIPATPVTDITRGAVGRHAKIGKTRVASHTHWRKSTLNAPTTPPIDHYDTFPSTIEH